jgi:hypothetical protein
MKTAIIISGAMRSFDRCLPTLHWHIFRHFPNADFFVSTVEVANSHKAELLRSKYPNARVEIEAVKEQPDCVAEMRGKGVSLPSEWVKGAPYTHEPYSISVHPQAVLRQLWQLEQGWRLYAAKGEGDYSTIIRCRPDLWFHSCEIFGLAGNGAALVPWWGGFGGVNDRFAILGTTAAARYFQTYLSIPRLMAAGCPLHPESLIAAALEGCYVSKLFAEFSTLRNNGEMRSPEISTIDLARLHA